MREERERCYGRRGKQFVWEKVGAAKDRRLHAVKTWPSHTAQKQGRV